MKKAMLALTFLFAALTFCGAFYVISNGGKPNAGFATIPMIITMVCFQWYNVYKNKEKQ